MEENGALAAPEDVVAHVDIRQLDTEALATLDTLHRDWFMEESSLGLDRAELEKALQNIACADDNGAGAPLCVS